MPIHDWTRVFPGVFHHFHHDWISALSAALNQGLLPPEYYALSEQIAGGFGPDVLALERRRVAALDQNGDSRPKEKGAPSGVALASAPPKVRHSAQGSEAEWYAQKKHSIVVRHRSGDDVVALVEVISPGNKSSRAAPREFVEKTVAFLRSGIHLLILDLFPPNALNPKGIHNALWEEVADDEFELPADKPLVLASYSSGVIPRCFVEAVAIGDLLPEMPLFIESETYVRVPLEAAYQKAYELVPNRWKEELDRGP